MESINAIYDGNAIKFLEPVPVQGKYEVVVTFTKSLEDKEEKIQKMLDCFGIWDNEDVKVMEEIIKERANFSMNRGEHDFS